MRKIFLSWLIFGMAQAAFCETLDLETAWQRVLYSSPAIAAADAEVSVLRGEAQQVSLMLNPVFEVESENLGVSDPSDDVEPPITTFSLEQTIELGGKRSARFNVASSLSCVAYWDAQIERENRLFELTVAFIHVRAAQEKLELAMRRREISQHIVEVVRKQIQGGKVPPIQEKRARLELMAEELTVREAQGELEQARTRLASMWGSPCPDFDCVEYALYAYAPPPCEVEVLGAFYQTPDYTKARQVLKTATLNLSLQKANRIPDVTFMGGYRIFHDSNSTGWVVGAEMPIPIFNRNQGSIRSAGSEIVHAEFQMDEIVRTAQERISQVHERMDALYEQSELMHQCMLKEAQETLRLTEIGYEKGKYEYLDLLDAQKMLFEVQEKYVDILSEFHLNRAELARLSGCRL